MVLRLVDFAELFYYFVHGVRAFDMILAMYLDPRIVFQSIILRILDSAYITLVGVVLL